MPRAVSSRRHRVPPLEQRGSACWHGTDATPIDCANVNGSGNGNANANASEVTGEAHGCHETTSGPIQRRCRHVVGLSSAVTPLVLHLDCRVSARPPRSQCGCDFDRRPDCDCDCVWNCGCGFALSGDCCFERAHAGPRRCLCCDRDVGAARGQYVRCVRCLSSFHDHSRPSVPPSSRGHCAAPLQQTDCGCGCGCGSDQGGRGRGDCCCGYDPAPCLEIDLRTSNGLELAPATGTGPGQTGDCYGCARGAPQVSGCGARSGRTTRWVCGLYCAPAAPSAWVWV